MEYQEIIKKQRLCDEYDGYKELRDNKQLKMLGFKLSKQSQKLIQKNLNRIAYEALGWKTYYWCRWRYALIHIAIFNIVFWGLKLIRYLF